jgi:protein-disulfide isomerase
VKLRCLVPLLLFFSGCAVISGDVLQSDIPVSTPLTQHLSGVNDFVGESPLLGRRDAPVTIMVFSDFTCSHCRESAQNLKEVSEEFPTAVRVVFKHSPNTPAAIPAAKAAIAAGVQGRFWEMHDLLFSEEEVRASEPLAERLNRFAQTIGLDVERFQRDRRSRAVAKLLLSDLRLGNRWLINSTPTFIVQGEVYAGTLSAPELRSLIRRALRSSR